MLIHLIHWYSCWVFMNSAIHTASKYSLFLAEIVMAVPDSWTLLKIQLFFLQIPILSLTSAFFHVGGQSMLTTLLSSTGFPTHQECLNPFWHRVSDTFQAFTAEAIGKTRVSTIYCYMLCRLPMDNSLWTKRPPTAVWEWLQWSSLSLLPPSRSMCCEDHGAGLGTGRMLRPRSTLLIL